MLQSFGIEGKATTTKNPQANAFVERIHFIIADYIRAMKLHEKPHDEGTTHAVLQAVAWSLRSTHHTTIQASPGQTCQSILPTLPTGDRFVSDNRTTPFSTTQEKIRLKFESTLNGIKIPLATHSLTR